MVTEPEAGPGSPPDRPLWLAPDGWSIEILDQTRLPHQVVVQRLGTLDQVVEAIVTMQVRGAPLIGITAAYGLCMALMTDDSDTALADAVDSLLGSRPTAVNLSHAVHAVRDAALGTRPGGRVAAAYVMAATLAQREVDACRSIGTHGVGLLRDLSQGRRRAVQVLTHCNAGWLATLRYGTALAPVYRAVEEQLPVHVWVDETRPRNQGWLTAWELAAGGVPHTVISDTMAAHLLQRHEVDIVIVGTDRTTRAGDVCNKIGTLSLALAARDAGIPFYAAVPSSSIDWSLDDWRTIPLEERGGEEVRWIRGVDATGMRREVSPGGTASPVRNLAFDVTPSHLLTGLITEGGIIPATREGLSDCFPGLEPIDPSTH